MIKITRFFEGDGLNYDKAGTPQSAVLTFTVTGTDDEAEALNAAINYANTEVETTPGLYRGLPYIGTEPIELIAAGIWRIKLKYQHQNAPALTTTEDEDSAAYEATYEVSTITNNIKTPRETILYAGTGSPDVINPADDGTVKGLDINIAVMSYTERHRFTNSKFTPAFRRDLLEYTNRVNKNTFRNFKAGEVLFTSFSATQTGDKNSDWVVTFNFKISPNDDDIEVGKNINGQTIHIGKKGWHYLEVRTATKMQDNKKVEYTKFVAVQRIYKTLDFAKLKIGRK